MCEERPAQEVLVEYGGVARRADLLAAGVSLPQLRRLVRTGELVRHGGSYGLADTPEIDLRLALSRKPGAVASHFTAARLHGITAWVDNRRAERPAVEALWVTRPPGRGRSEDRSDLVVRRAAIDPPDVHLVCGVACTSAERTAVDLARELPFREAVVVLDHALSTGVPRAAMAGELERQTRWPGAGSARDAVAFASGLAESPLESLARVLFHELGMPAPMLQAEPWDDRRPGRECWTGLRVDFCWPRFWLIVEVDGMAKYESTSATGRREIRRREHEREQWLADLGFEVLRLTWEDVLLRPAEVAARLRRAMTRAAARRTAPGPAPVRPYFR